MKLFENAKKYYAEARDIIAKLADSVPEGKTEGTRDAHRRSTLRQYNVIMQTVMLACAVADGKILDGELEFIAALGLDGGGISVDWAELKNYSAEDNKQLSEEMTEMVAPVARSFIEKCKGFAAHNTAVYARLDQLTCAILNEFCSSDGEMTEDEYSAGASVLSGFIKTNWGIGEEPSEADATSGPKRKIVINGEEITDPDIIDRIIDGSAGDRALIGKVRINIGGGASAGQVGSSRSEEISGGLISALDGLLEVIGGIRSAGAGSASGDRPIIPRGAGNGAAPDTAPKTESALPALEINASDDKLLNYAKNRKDFTNAVIFIRTSVGEGSGFVISKDGYAATNAHVVGDETRVRVRFAAPLAPQGFIDARVIVKDTVHDLAIIKLDTNEYYHCEIDCSGLEAEIGSEVALLGFPLGSNLTDNVEELNISLARGYVSSNQTRNGQRTTFLDIKAFHGNSGGPIVSLESGLIIGILVGAVLDQAGGLTMMIPVRYLNELVCKFK